FERGARAQAPDHRHETAAPVGVRVARIDVERDPQFGLRRREQEIARHYADDLALHAVEPDRGADDLGVGGEALPPEGLAENHEIALTGEIFAGVEGSS